MIEAAIPATLPLRVSIVMATYNHAPYIAQAIEGVLMQETEFAYELLLGDDCSTDGTGEICARYAERHPDQIILFRRERNLGAQENGKELCRACRGEFIAFCEGDDYWTHPLKLHRQVAALDAHPDWSGCFHKTLVSVEGNPAANSHLPDVEPSGQLSLRDLAERNYIATCSVIYRRGLVPEIPAWLSSLPMGDWPLSMLYAARGPLGYVSEEMAVYRMHAGGMWSPLDHVTRVDHSLRMRFEIEGHLTEPAQSMVVEGRRAYLQWLLYRHDEELSRLRKIESRYRALQLHRLAAIGKWIKQLLGR